MEISGVKWLNSPNEHIVTKNSDNQYYHDFEIEVDAKGQLELNRLFAGA